MSSSDGMGLLYITNSSIWKTPVRTMPTLEGVSPVTAGSTRTKSKNAVDASVLLIARKTVYGYSIRSRCSQVTH